MFGTKMTFQEIKADRDQFLERYGLWDQFHEYGISWEKLLEIGEDYEKKRNSEYLDLIQKYIIEISQFKNVHSYRYRIKTTDSLLAKIIRKNKPVTLDNYFNQITDLLGIRILYVFKSDYLSIHEQIMEHYGNQLAENVHLKLKDGDDEQTYNDLCKKYDVKKEKNKEYRSIHYTIYAKSDNIDKYPKVEIQTRTIFEEGWSEINHKLVYKEMDIEILAKASRILSELVGSCDAVGSMMKDIFEEPIKESSEKTVANVINSFLKR